MMSSKNHQGFTLIELLVAIAVGLIITAAVMALFISMLNSNTEYLKSVRLHHELRSALSAIVRDIKRTGHNRSAASSLTANPFSSSTTNTVLTIPNSTTIYFSYDEDVGNVETYGYRLNGGAIEFCSKQDGTPCDTASPWEDITDPDLVEITSLVFSDPDPTPVIVGGMRLREVSISVTGRLKNDTAFTRTLTEVVKIRNDHATTW